MGCRWPQSQNLDFNRPLLSACSSTFCGCQNVFKTDLIQFFFSFSRRDNQVDDKLKKRCQRTYQSDQICLQRKVQKTIKSWCWLGNTAFACHWRLKRLEMFKLLLHFLWFQSTFQSLPPREITKEFVLSFLYASEIAGKFSIKLVNCIW